MAKVFEALANGQSLELRMYGVIGRRWDDNAVTSEAVSRALKENPSCKNILVKISSPGGAAFEGLTIRSMLAAHPAHVTTEVEGLAASAASVIAMAGDVIRMHAGSALMIHEASTMTEGDAQEHERAISALEALNDGMATIYAARSGMDKNKCREMMSAETWLTPEAAMDKGFCDEITAAKQPSSATAAFDLGAFGYKNAPEWLAADGSKKRPKKIAVGDRITVSADMAHSPEASGDGTVAEISTSALGIRFDSMPDEIHHWYVESEVQRLPPSAAKSVQKQQFTAIADQATQMEKPKMSLARIATALGLADSAEEAAVIAALGKAQARMTAAEGVLAELRAVASAEDNDALMGAVRGYKDAAAQLPALKAQVDAQAKSLEEQERSALFAADAADPAGRKLTPATQEYWKGRPVAELKSYLAVAPVVMPATAAKTTPSSQQNTPASAAVSGATPEKLTHDGKAWEDFTPQEKHLLFENAATRSIYYALKANHAARGKPLPSKTNPSKRASA